MDTACCPGCGAAVRAQADWCSLCYQDLRPAPRLVTVPQTAADVPAPLVEAALEPGPVHLDELGAAKGVVDAHLVDQDSDQPAAPGRLSADVSWPCPCGRAVPLAENTCPDCGSTFLGELQDGANGKHRRQADRGLWPKTRGPRIALSLLIALLVAVGIPMLLSLFG